MSARPARARETPHPADDTSTGARPDPVEEADIESFPASDPPAWTAVTVTRLEKNADGEEHEMKKKGGKTTP